MPFDQLRALLLPVLRSDFDWLTRVQAYQEQRFEFFFRAALLVITDEISDVFAEGNETTALHLGLNEILEGRRKGYVEGCHAHTRKVPPHS